MSTANSKDAKTVIFCTRTAHAIDVLGPGKVSAERIAALAPEYGPDLTLLSSIEALERSEAPLSAGWKKSAKIAFTRC